MDWWGDGDDEARATFGALEILVGPERQSLTEAEDTVAKTVRPHIFVPASLVAEWLLANWWRLRWESRPEKPDYAWRCAHSLAAVGHGYAWPDVEMSSDGEFIQIRAAPSSAFAGSVNGCSGGDAHGERLFAQLASLGLSDQVTFATLNVSGRSLAHRDRQERSHGSNHHVAVVVGKPFKAGGHRRHRRRGEPRGRGGHRPR